MSLPGAKLRRMRQVEYFHWIVTDERTGQRRRTRFRMSREVARQAYPDAEPVPGSREWRWLPDTPMPRPPSIPRAAGAGLAAGAGACAPDALPVPPRV